MAQAILAQALAVRALPTHSRHGGHEGDEGQEGVKDCEGQACQGRCVPWQQREDPQRSDKGCTAQEQARQDSVQKGVRCGQETLPIHQRLDSAGQYISARKELGVTGFCVVGGKTAQGRALYAKAKSFYSEWTSKSDRGSPKGKKRVGSASSWSFMGGSSPVDVPTTSLAMTPPCTLYSLAVKYGYARRTR